MPPPVRAARVIALDAVTGELLWVHGEKEGARGAAAPRQLSGRGPVYWSDGKEARILYVTPGYQLIALDAKTGQRIPSFGNNGAVDLKADDDQKISPDLTTGEIGWQSAPTVVGDMVLVGSAFREGFTPTSFKNNKGSARAYDVRTGKKLWEFHTIPQKGEPGEETWLNNSNEYTGNTGVWTEMTADPEAGLAYLPVEQPTSDFYGGKRPGAGLYGNSLVAVDLNTGKVKWYFQLIHHEIWDYRHVLGAAADGHHCRRQADQGGGHAHQDGHALCRSTASPASRSGRSRSARSRRALCRANGIRRPSPFPPSRSLYADRRVGGRADRLHARAACRGGGSGQELQDGSDLSRRRCCPTPTARSPPSWLGAANGGTNWPGGSFNPENHTVYVYGCNSCMSLTALVPPPPGMTDLPYVEGLTGQKIVMVNAAGADQGADAAPAPKRPPPPAGGDATVSAASPSRACRLLKPPYATISAINLDKGEIVWQVAHGDTPDCDPQQSGAQGHQRARAPARPASISAPW